MIRDTDRLRNEPELHREYVPSRFTSSTLRPEYHKTLHSGLLTHDVTSFLRFSNKFNYTTTQCSVTSVRLYVELFHLLGHLRNSDEI
jgi:hypothetical protein